MCKEIGIQRMEWEYKVWGRVAHVFTSGGVAVDCLEVKAGYQCSRHHHADKSNTFLVVSGTLLVVKWPDSGVNGTPTTGTRLTPGQTCTVETNVDHKFLVIESGVVIEYYTATEGELVRADDIVRIDKGDKSQNHEWDVTNERTD